MLVFTTSSETMLASNYTSKVFYFVQFSSVPSSFSQISIKTFSSIGSPCFFITFFVRKGQQKLPLQNI